MSEVEHHRGKATEIKPINGEKIEDIAKRLLDENSITFEQYYETYLECLIDNCPERFVCVSDKIYECESTNIDPYDDLSIAIENEDGTIDFEVKYYNGGCGFEEAVEGAINKMNKLTPS